MCGAPSLPPVAVRFASRTAAAYDDDAMGAGSPATPAGSSSSETSGPCDFSKDARLMVEAAWGMAAAQQMPRRQRPPFAAKRPGNPERRRGQGSPATAMLGAPAPRPIKLRDVLMPPPPVADVVDAGSPDHALPPIKLRYVSLQPAADVSDAGSSVPSTPSDCSWMETTRSSAPSTPSDCSWMETTPSTPSDCSWMETTPSPRGPLPGLWNPPAPCELATTARPLPPRPFPTEPAPRVEVRQVWAHNFDMEAELIESLLPKFRYAAVDTEFPGTVYRPAGAAYTLTPERRYELLRLNVDALDLIQLGLTLFDAGGRLPSLGAGAPRYVWEFNFRDFDVRRHRHAPESIALLRSKGVDFGRTRQHGVAAAAFGPRLRRWLRAGLGRAGVVTFSGGYDLAYLVKAMFGAGFKMPASAGEFEGVVKAALLRRRLFDVKEMARLCPTADLRGGLDSVAVKLNVRRAVGEAHQAGSDSLLTCHAFMKMRESFFDGDDGELGRVAGVLTDVTAY